MLTLSKLNTPLPSFLYNSLEKLAQLVFVQPVRSRSRSLSLSKSPHATEPFVFAGMLALLSKLKPPLPSFLYNREITALPFLPMTRKSRSPSLSTSAHVAEPNLAPRAFKLVSGLKLPLPSFLYKTVVMLLQLLLVVSQPVTRKSRSPSLSASPHSTEPANIPGKEAPRVKPPLPLFLYTLV